MGYIEDFESCALVGGGGGEGRTVLRGRGRGEGGVFDYGAELGEGGLAEELDGNAKRRRGYGTRHCGQWRWN